MSIVAGALRVAWSYLAPWLGPLVLKVAPWLGPWVAAFSLKRFLRAAAIAALAGVTAWGTWRLTRPDPHHPRMVSVSEVEAQRFKAENESLKKALAKQAETLRMRDLEASDAEMQLEMLRTEKEVLRAQSSDPDAPVFPADDPWLRGRRR